MRGNRVPEFGGMYECRLYSSVLEWVDCVPWISDFEGSSNSAAGFTLTSLFMTLKVRRHLGETITSSSDEIY